MGFIKTGDSQILSVINADELTDEQRKAIKASEDAKKLNKKKGNSEK